MINAIIYSKDRAPQLRLLLESIKLNAPGVFNINILYKSSTQEFEKGYYKLMMEGAENNMPNISWLPESGSSLRSFKELNSGLISRDYHPEKYEFTCFFTDDDIIYQPINEQEIIDCLNSDDDVFCFSLRLGKNITVCYTQNSGNVLIPLEETDSIVKWDWSVHYMDFGYPLSVDGHIFRTEDIQTLSNKVPYVNPNTFEAALQIFDNFPKNKMAAFLNSKLVNTPANIVQNVFPNRKGEKYGFSVEELNKKYLSDEVIDYSAIDFNDIKGCHQELNFEFTKLVTS